MMSSPARIFCAAAACHSLVGGRPARSHQSSQLLPDGARYFDSKQPRCLRHTIHHAIPFDHRLETYYEAGQFHEICRPVAAAGALTGWPSAVGKEYKGKWGVGSGHSPRPRTSSPSGSTSSSRCRRARRARSSRKVSAPPTLARAQWPCTQEVLAPPACARQATSHLRLS